MQVIETRWGEVTIKKQAGEKNKFDKTKSFSIIATRDCIYDIEDYAEILKIATNLTALYPYKEIKNKLLKLQKV